MLREGGDGRELRLSAIHQEHDLRLVGGDEEQEQECRPNAHPLVHHEEGEMNAPTVNSCSEAYSAKSYSTPVKIAIGPVRPIRIIGCPARNAHTIQAIASPTSVSTMPMFM